MAKCSRNKIFADQSWETFRRNKVRGPRSGLGTRLIKEVSLIAMPILVVVASTYGLRHALLLTSLAQLSVPLVYEPLFAVYCS